MFEGVDPSNIFSGIGFGRYENFNLLSITNALFTKLWDDPESSNAQNGQSGVGRKMVQCVSHLWRLVLVIGGV